jgi:hypothetical protein
MMTRETLYSAWLKRTGRAGPEGGHDPTGEWIAVRKGDQP